jgi:hypothetical protein
VRVGEAASRVVVQVYHYSECSFVTVRINETIAVDNLNGRVIW